MTLKSCGYSFKKKSAVGRLQSAANALSWAKVGSSLPESQRSITSGVTRSRSATYSLVRWEVRSAHANIFGSANDRNDLDMASVNLLREADVLIIGFALYRNQRHRASIF